MIICKLIFILLLIVIITQKFNMRISNWFEKHQTILSLLALLFVVTGTISVIDICTLI